MSSEAMCALAFIELGRLLQLLGSILALAFLVNESTAHRYHLLHERDPIPGAGLLDFDDLESTTGDLESFPGALGRKRSTEKLDASTQTDITTNNDIVTTTMINGLSQLATLKSELQRERERGGEELVAARAEARSVKDLFMASLAETRQEYQALVLKAQERQNRDEETIAELKQRLERTEAQAVSAESSNRLLVEKNEEYEASSTSMQETIRTLMENNESTARWLSLAEQTVAQHSETITELITRNAELEAAMVSRDTRIHCLSREWETLREQVARGEETIFKQTRDVEQKMKEASEWRELYYCSGSTAQQRRRHNSSMLSIAGMLAEKDETIEELKDRLSECHSLLSVCSCTPIGYYGLAEAPLMLPIPDKGAVLKHRPLTCT